MLILHDRLLLLHFEDIIHHEDIMHILSRKITFISVTHLYIIRLPQLPKLITSLSEMHL